MEVNFYVVFLIHTLSMTPCVWLVLCTSLVEFKQLWKAFVDLFLFFFPQCFPWFLGDSGLSHTHLRCNSEYRYWTDTDSGTGLHLECHILPHLQNIHTQFLASHHLGNILSMRHLDKIVPHDCMCLWVWIVWACVTALTFSVCWVVQDL